MLTEVHHVLSCIPAHVRHSNIEKESEVDWVVTDDEAITSDARYADLKYRTRGTVYYTASLSNDNDKSLRFAQHLQCR